MTLGILSISIVEVDETRIQKRLDTKYLDVMSRSLDEALKMAEKALSEEAPFHRAARKLRGSAA